jgi:hypothetical protein
MAEMPPEDLLMNAYGALNQLARWTMDNRDCPEDTIAFVVDVASDPDADGAPLITCLSRTPLACPTPLWAVTLARIEEQRIIV